ncbi:MAG TPA: DUF2130 domain-containing protein [Acholeplasmataceae bacterium]|jgi:hypothetical protein|nr:DUF2130 domain-containing protein [Acholeplasmataceae bacterium]
MSKKVKVSVVDSKTLRLEEDALKGSIIDLNEVMELDTTSILKLIEDGRDKVYHEKVSLALADQHKLLKSQEATELLKLQNKINNLTDELKNEELRLNNLKELALAKQKEEFTLKSNSLQKEIEILKTKLEGQAKTIELQQEAKFNKEISELNNQIERLKSEKEAQRVLFNQTLESKITQEQLKLTQEFGEEKDKLQKVISEQEAEVNKLRLSKDSLNVKMLGENLEKWCEQEFMSSTLSMLPNVTFYKDTKGDTKADFIFRIYLDGEEKTEVNELASVSLEMKSEHTVSKSKTKNKDHYEKLDEDREKNNTTYALLVSELEWDAINDTPIRKITEYSNMYLVRPQYMTTFLNIIYAFAMQYHAELSKRNKELEKFKDRIEILNEFEQMKSQILDNSLRHIQTKLNEISKETENIESANNKIKEALRIVLETHINTVINRITNFEINKIIKKTETNNQ